MEIHILPIFVALALSFFRSGLRRSRAKFIFVPGNKLLEEIIKWQLHPESFNRDPTIG